MVENKEIKNAVIKHASITFDRGTFLTVWLDLDYGGVCQGLGGFGLGKIEEYCWKPYAHCYIQRVMEIAGIERWEDLEGRPIRVDVKKGYIAGIGHFLEDKWFYPREELEEIRLRTEGECTIKLNTN